VPKWHNSHQHCHNDLIVDQSSTTNMKRSIMKTAWSAGLTSEQPDSIRTKGEYEAFDHRNPPRGPQLAATPSHLFSSQELR
jgi:hypothetical protein